MHGPAKILEKLSLDDASSTLAMILSLSAWPSRRLPVPFSIVLLGVLIPTKIQTQSRLISVF
ncbi:hypothetical protein HBH56_018290 [Parastagonospora nodorum]|uniref:Uncharacterized protein n=2 Tax=Phaeosphaeria nodorum (strain SN15 / ATCC MYA-4574 / FGSC 10173) TaxID=321614 RepID=A0A7U2EYY0_PHANO|nr:hypothetical protein SNOG_02956 [Parastagonospora nodorum SN15]KAH3919752.1 hypothetical protein HBH56_018290 [Parastagonospora nodorum]EAT89687.1 hypothetical protein SNOG_02956 [Parastagonospora nodorum SN15]KAH3937094.1 hypothetical protein HBH54_016200 [Parastagonospora nodorum]KAH3990015.1 hypothetical protein HBH52_005120 [Parastagonospora nodorum]KAH4136980.1 hypothetical protein HBH45_124600 [Parastagonospora nodorum]